ncbi:MAG: pilus assembly protein, partial [Geminicoccaceae bacterium]
TLSIRLVRDNAGAVLAEFAYTAAFIFILGLIVFDFSLFFMRMAMAEYAAHVAVRIAAVRPAVCDDVPESISKDPDDETTRYGTLCTDPANPCEFPVPAVCSGAADAVSVEIMNRISPFLPPGATTGNLQFTYAPPANQSIGFLGGPYVPIVSVSLQNLTHDFILPIPTLLSPWSGGAGGGAFSINLPPMTATMPGEDLNSGTEG